MSGAVDYLVWQENTQDVLCVVDQHRRWTYREFAERIDAVAAQLAAAGTSSGDIVGIRMPNSLESLVALMAVWRLGAVAAPLDPAHTENPSSVVTALLVLDEEIPDRWQPGGARSISVEAIAWRAPVGWVAPAPPSTGDTALVYAGTETDPQPEEISHFDLCLLAWQTIRYLGLNDRAVCSIAQSVSRAEVIAMNFLPALLVGAQVRLDAGRQCATPAARGGSAVSAMSSPACTSRSPVDGLVS